MIKVLHVISAPVAGGAEVYVKDLVLNSQKHNIQASILFISNAKDINRSELYEKQFIHDLKSAGINYCFLPSGSRRNLTKGFSTYKSLLKKLNPNIVHSHLLSGIVYNLISFKKVPLIYTHHNSVISINKYLFKILISQCSFYIGISELCSNFLKKFINKDKQLITINNAVDRSRLKVTTYKKSENVEILAIGSLTIQKNYPLMIEVIKSVKKKTKVPFKLSIAGEGSSDVKSKMLRLIADYKLQEDINLLGNRADIPELLQRSDLFLMTSDWEGLPIALIEAQLLGIPSLVTDTGGCPEIISQTGGGDIAVVNDKLELVNKLVKLIEDQTYRDLKSKNALNNSFVYDIEYALNSHFEVYNKFLSYSCLVKEYNGR